MKRRRTRWGLADIHISEHYTLLMRESLAEGER